MKASPNVTELLAKAQKPSEDSLRLHPFYRGKQELARFKEGAGLTEDAILPTMDDREVFPREAAAVGLKAIEQGVASKVMTKDELIENASKIITRAQMETKTLMEHGLIADVD
jgi:malate dehydrogenase (oxaloacetate-decarboxylating)